MPELPEVETIARGLQKRVAGDSIQSVWLGEKPQSFKSQPEEIVRRLGACANHDGPYGVWASISSSTWNTHPVARVIPSSAGSGSFTSA